MALADDINGKTKVYGLIGNPIGHTFSPMIHNTLAQLTGENLVYCALPVGEPERIGEAVRGAFALGIQGMNVTVPYKSAVMPFLEEIDPMAKAIGAVNTLVRTEQGYKGYNTDYIGLQTALEEHGIVFPGTVNERPDGERILVRNVVIIGAGGAARAAGFMCGSVGVKHLTILNRTAEKAEALAGEIRAEFPDMQTESRPLKDAGRVPYDSFLAIQCTKVGLSPNIDEIPTTSATFYRRVQAAYDCIYNPEETRFLAEVRRRGKPCWNGLDMLLWQGIAAYRLWTGVKVTKEQAQSVKEALTGFLDQKERAANFVLVGFMGSGKTTVGEALAGKLGWQHLDTDALIVRESGKTINQIFKESGEEGFRQQETRLLQKLAEDPFCFTSQAAPEKAPGQTVQTGKHTSATPGNPERGGIVFSTGGGIVLRPENLPLLHRLGTVVLLDVTPAAVVARIGKDSSRPLLQGKDRLRKVSTLLSRRQASYQAAADLTVNTVSKTPEEIADEILRRTH